MVAILGVTVISSMLAFMPHAPAPVSQRSAVRSHASVLPVPQPLVVHSRTPRCPAVKAATTEQLEAVAIFLGVFGGLPFLLATLSPQNQQGAAGPTREFDEKFLAENKLKEGVVTLPSGLQYKVLRAGTGDSSPLPDSPCDCHYEGRCAKDWPTGKTFDSSYERGAPTTFAPNQVIKGWTEAMQLMVEGDKWEMYIPSNLAYGDNGRVAGCLVFTMEIIKIKGGTKPKAA